MDTIDNKERLGLNDEQVAESRRQHGRNVLTPPKRTPLWKLYLDKFRDPIIQILLVAAAVSLIFSIINGEYMETLGIFLAIFLATTIGFYFECDAAKKFSLLTALGEEQPVKVRRNGKVMEVPRSEVVVGDVILLETGDEVPADGRLIDVNELQINESSLTGEPIADKSLNPEGDGDDHGAYPRNVVLRSSMVMSGRGEAVVTAIGDATEIGKVARKSTESTAVKTPLNMQLDKLAKFVSKIGLTVSFVAFAIFLIHDILVNPLWGGNDYLRMAQVVLKYFMMAVTLIVMAVPEGLPMTVTLALALNMRRMLKSNNLVRKLHACETMGAVTVICTDKTGTLTQNKMQVQDFAIENEQLLNEAIAFNSTAELDGNQGIGNPTEIALLLWLQGKGVDYRQLRESGKVESQQPFSTETKYMKTVATIDGQRHEFVKGAPEIVMGMCNLSQEKQAEIQKLLLSYQEKAMRTLGFALDGKWQGVAAISDPIREDVPAAVERCQGAGITVKIVTGDTVATATEIGRQIGLFEGIKHNGNIEGVYGTATDTPEGKSRDSIPPHYTITGPEWAALSDEEAYKRAAEIRVMSRARPTDKQRLVHMLQKRGEVVAVTGDGTNDAPALHYAHVGLSLGSGTSVAKEASDMTLLDDSFGSIANAVMWGRSLYKNIQRFLFFQLVVNLTALLLVLGGSLIGTEMPLTVTQILWVNLIMDTFAAMALASLPPSREVMKDKPRKQSDFIITPGMGKAILWCGLIFFAAMFVFLFYCERNGEGGVDRHELTWFFTTFVMLQFWNLFNAKAYASQYTAFHRFLADKGLMLVLLFILVGQWFIVTFGGDMFRTEPLSWKEWLIIFVATSPVLWIGELIRGISRMKKAKA